jgi:PAS domain S-box-containing protein
VEGAAAAVEMSLNARPALESPDSGTLLRGERKVLELIATGAPLETILDALCRVIDEQSGLTSSIFLLDDTGKRLTLTAGPHVPDALRAAVASFPVTVTACGAAVTRRQQIISPDIASDPLYAGFHDAAQTANIRAVWSTPFFSKHERPLGTFAVYSSVIGPPSTRNLDLVSRATHLASIAVERKRAEHAVRVSERRWRSVFDNSAIGIVMGDSTLRVAAANRAVQALGGYSEQELSVLTLFDVTHPDDRHLVEQAVADLLAGARERQIEKRFLRKNGEVIWVRTTASLIQETNEPLRFLALVEDISARKAAEQKLAESLNHLRALAARLMQTQDDERRRIARMLHETTAQDLAGLKMLLARLNRTSDRLSDADRVLLHESVQVADRSMNELRTLAYLLHPPFLDEVGLLSAVRWYIQGFADRSGIEVSLDLPEALARLTQDVETTLFRVIQEALINIHRHAGSRTAHIRLRVAADRLTLEIEDHGRGMPPDFVARLMGGTGAIGVGLAGIRERLEQLGGALEIESSDDGTIVRAIVPVPEAAS